MTEVPRYTPPLKDAVVFHIVRTVSPAGVGGGETEPQDNFHVRLVADNGDKMFWSENYTQRHNALSAVHWLVNHFGYTGNYRVENVDE